MGNDLFETFDNGSLRLPESTAEFADIPWTKHPAFDGVLRVYSIFAWRQPDNSLKAAVEVALVTKSCGICRFGHAFPFLQKLLPFSYPALYLELMRRQTTGRFKLPDHVIRKQIRRH